MRSLLNNVFGRSKRRQSNLRENARRRAPRARRLICELLEDRRMLSSYDLSIVGEQPHVGKVGLFGNGQAEQGIAFIRDQGWVTSSGSSSCAVGTCEDSAITFYDVDWGETSQILYEPDDGGSNFFLNDHEYNVKHIGDVAYGNGHIYAPLQLDLVDDSGNYDGIVDIEYLARYTAAGALDASWGITFPTGIEIGGVGYYDGRLYAAEYVKSTTQDEWRRARVLEYGVADTSSYEKLYLNVPYINGIAFRDVNEFRIPIVHFAFGGSAADPKAPVGVSFWDEGSFTEGTGAIAVVPLAELTAHTNQSDPLEVTRSDYYTYLSRPHAEGLTFDGDGDLWVSRGETVAELDLSLAPIADAGGDYSAGEGSTITLDASGSYDPDGSIASYEWDLDNDGQYDDHTGVTAAFSRSNEGTYTVGVRVTDDDGNTDTDSATVTVSGGASTVDLLGTYFDAPTALSAGEAFDVTYAVANNGTANSGQFYVEWYISRDTAIDTSDRSLARSGFIGLDGGTSTGHTTKGLTLPEVDNSFWTGDGTYYIGMIVDPDRWVPESDETNNSSRGNGLDRDQVQITGTPSIVDLLGTYFDAPAALTAGQTFDVTYEIGNDGTANSGGFAAEWYISKDSTIEASDRQLARSGFVGLSGGSSTGQLPKSLTLPAADDSFWSGDGLYYIGMIVDPDGVVSESDETNNSNRGNGLDRDQVQITGTSTHAEMRGLKWNDLDRDGEKDAGEPGLEGWTIYVDENSDGQWNGATEESHYAVTGPDGTYVITDVPAGSHTVREVQQTGWEQTYPSDSTTTTSLTFPAGTNVPATILDLNGNGTGFTDRLPGTGADYTGNDPNLDLSANTGFLTITSTRADLGTDPVANPDVLEAYGLLLPNVGDQDVTIKALFRDIQVYGYHSSNQLTLYAGQSATQNLRAGIHYYHDHDYALWSRNPNDGVTHAWTTPSDASWSDGDDVELTLSRQDGRWQLDWHNLTNDDAGASDSLSLPWVDGNDLYAGIHYANARSSTSRTSLVESFTVEVKSDCHVVNLSSGETQQNINFGNRLLLDFGDAPDSYKTLFSSDGARHVPTGPMLGSSRDSEADGQPNDTATGDDLAEAPPDDEDGVTLDSPVVVGQVDASVTVNVQQVQATWSLQDTLTASDGATGHRFGQHVSVSDNWAIVGAPNRNSDTGAVYAYERVGEEWFERSSPIATGEAAGDTFGMNVSVSGNYAIVGAYRNDERASNAGAAYIYERIGENWVETKLMASDGAAGDQFGSRVAISGDWAIAGAAGKDSGRGAAYIFYNDPVNGWQQYNEPLVAPVGAGDSFGGNVAICENYAIVGAPHWGDSDPGTAYVYQFSGSTWDLIATLTQSEPAADDGFGMSVDITTEYAVVGTPYDDDEGRSSGAVYVFEKPEAGWGDMTETVQLHHPDGSDSVYFANVSLSDQHLLVGAAGANSAYLFKLADLEAGTPPSPEVLSASGSSYLGGSVDISDDTIIVGADLTDGWTGAAYVFQGHSDEAKLDAWMDFNRDGDWDDPGEQIFTSRSLAYGDNPLTFTIPTSASPGTTFARFRLSSSGGLTYRGEGDDGEVEDYALEIGGIDSLGMYNQEFFYLDATGNGKWDKVSGGDTFRDFGINPLRQTATPVVGDWDGDGDDDLGVFNHGYFYLDTTGNGKWDKVSGGDTFRDFGINPLRQTATPVTGDWDGDGDDDLGLFNHGYFYLDTSGNGNWDKVSGGDTFRDFGINAIRTTATPVIGDWDGDGDDDLGLYHEELFYLDTSGNGVWDKVSGGDTFRDFGINPLRQTATPVVGDWDGDGDDDLGLFNRGYFYLDTTENGKWDRVSGGDTFRDFGINSIRSTGLPLAGQWPARAPLLAAGGAKTPDAAVTDLTGEQLAPVLDHAMALWAATDTTESEWLRLQQVDVTIGDLPDGVLGNADATLVTIDTNAAGYGWFVDSTPDDSVEFAMVAADTERVAEATSDAFGRMDLLTVVLHELGHVLGAGHSRAPSVMAEDLPAGTRRLPEARVQGDGSTHTGSESLTVPADDLFGVGDTHGIARVADDRAGLDQILTDDLAEDVLGVWGAPHLVGEIANE